MNTVFAIRTDSQTDLQESLQPFLAVLMRPEQRWQAPLYQQEILGTGGAQKCRTHGRARVPHAHAGMSPLRIDLALASVRREQVLRKTVDTLVGRKDAALIVDYAALPKQGNHSVGVKPPIRRAGS